MAAAVALEDIAREEMRRSKRRVEEQRKGEETSPNPKATSFTEEQKAAALARANEARTKLQLAQERAKELASKHPEVVITPTDPITKSPEETKTEHKPAAERGGLAEQLQGVIPVDKPRKVAPGVVARKGKGKQSKSHQNFYNELVKAASINDPYLLATMLVRYSSQIEDDDFDTSMKLLAIAEGILDK